MNERWTGSCAIRIGLPLLWLERRWRLLRRAMGSPYYFVQPTRLPVAPWQECVATVHAPRLLEPELANGNVRLAELGVLAALARDCPDGTNLFEIGTFDGRTTLNLALNAPDNCAVYTLDIPAEHQPKFAIAKGEKHMIRKRRSGARWEAARASHPGAVARIRQLWGDSATFDYYPFQGTCSFVFVDGSHAYDYVVSDSRAALALVRPGGIVIWHDYGAWEGVTRALEEMHDRDRMDLRNVRGTSLVVYRNGSRADQVEP